MENVYAEIFRTLKPGGKFACYEWLTTEKYDESNLEHKRIIHDLEEGNSLPKLYTIPMCLAALKKVGFEVLGTFFSFLFFIYFFPLESGDLANPKSTIALQAQEAWYAPLKGPEYSLSSLFSIDQLSRFTMTPFGRTVTDSFVYVLELLGLAPPGTGKVSKVLNLGADSLVLAGDLELFTPMYFFVARKPE